MAKPTLEAIYSQARSRLGDDGVAGGSIFTDTVLQPHVDQSVRELFRVLRGTEDPFVLTDAYFVLPANTGVLDPATAGLANFAEPEWLGVQLAATPIGITNVVVTLTPGAPVATVTTASPHGLANGATVVVYNAGGFDYFNNPNDLWIVNVGGPSTLLLNGCTATGTYTSGGEVLPVTGNFTPMDPVDILTSVPQTAGQLPVNSYAWEGGVLRFYPSAQAQLLHITYRTSGTVGTNPLAVVPIDDSQDFLAVRAAGLAGMAKGAIQLGQQLTAEAIGPQLQADANGGLLRQLVQISVRNMQRIQYRQQSFRARRNRNDYVLW